MKIELFHKNEPEIEKNLRKHIKQDRMTYETILLHILHNKIEIIHGKNTWIMLARNARWHWIKDEKKSLWYPSAKLFRQEKAGNWNSVINSINMDLIKLVKYHELNFSKTDKRDVSKSC